MPPRQRPEPLRDVCGRAGTGIAQQPEHHTSTELESTVPSARHSLIALIVGFQALLLGPMACDDAVSSDSPFAPFEAALPREGDLALMLQLPTHHPDVPDNLRLERNGLQGELPDALTWDLPHFVDITLAQYNNAIAAVTKPLQAVLEQLEPTFTETGKAFWSGQPHQGPEEFNLLVEVHGGQHYTFNLASRPKPPGGEGQWRFRLGGSYTNLPLPGTAHGSVWVNLDNDPNPKTRGRFLFYWERHQGDRAIQAYAFEATYDNDSLPSHSSTYEFNRSADGHGDFRYGTHDRNILTLNHPPEASPQEPPEPGEPLEDGHFVAAWSPNGHGRADGFATGGDLMLKHIEAGHIGQCWNEAFDVGWQRTHLEYEDGQDAIEESGSLLACEGYDTPLAWHPPPPHPEPPDLPLPKGPGQHAPDPDAEHGPTPGGQG